MNIDDRLENVKSRDDIINFLNFLSDDKIQNKEQWENQTIEEYLLSICSFIEELDSYYKYNELPMPDKENWNFIARLLYVGKVL